jgi:hypothetical protein
MPVEPIVQPLPRSHRRLVFWSFLTLFVVAMPSLWFYTTGYRFDWTNEEGGIVGVGGLYISTDAQNVEFYVDEAQVTDFRIFRKAAYIQNLVEGKHSIHVQGVGLQTWAKDLPVQSYIVTEAFAFMMPSVPHVRVITEYQTATGTAVLRLRAPLPKDPYFAFASTTNAYIATTSRATTTLVQNQEYRYVRTLFASSTATSTSLVAQLSDRIERQFVPRLGTSTDDALLATSTREDQGMRAFIADGEVNVSWVGDTSERPNYFCVPDVSTSTSRLYGEHVYQDLIEEAIRRGVAATIEAVQPLIIDQRLCRDSIRIDRKGMEVRAFEFFPNTPGLVLMLLDDGLYVVEVDDRAWQNTQLLYPGEDLMFVVDGGRIYVEDREQYLEVLTTVPN